VPHNVLVVDDDELIQMTLRTILEDEGYTVQVAGDGLAALEALESFVPAVILLDISMPRMDGYEFAGRLQQMGLREQIPLIVLTADGRAQQKATHVGAAGWVSKPFTIDRLLDVVSQAAQ
jgi:CheY-like chemotaxis protein